jgi:unsaturated rhamnogalacturonyl hydrolase
MKSVFKLAFCLLLLSGVIAGQSLVSTSVAKVQPSSPTSISSKGNVDVSRAIVDATIERLPTASDLGPWEYSRALFLIGELSVYRRTHDPKYLDYARQWADSHINEQGVIDHTIDSLDFIMPGNLALGLYQLTGEKKYKVAAEKLASAFSRYPRTRDGGFWHGYGNSHGLDPASHQLWLDGTYMALPFLIHAGALSGDQESANAEATQQLLIYTSHLKDADGPLFFHAYDETGKAAWANPVTHQSSVKWGRSIGWYSMALVDVLDTLPQTPSSTKEGQERMKLIAIAQQLAHDLALYQDPATGLWFQIVDQPKLAGNFLETSCSSMFTYFLDVAVKRGYVDQSYRTVADKGYRGVLSKVGVGADGSYHVTDICEGTMVGDEASYLARKRYTDDFHGLGAFLLMNEEVQYNHAATPVRNEAH